MELITIFLIAVCISLDTFAISATRGILLKNFKVKYAAIIAAYFTFFHVAMILLGWLLGKQFSDVVKQFSYWIVFLVLAFLGAKMIYESMKSEKGMTIKTNPISCSTMVPLAFATSIDAFAVGVSFALLAFSIQIAVIIVILVTLVFSMVGVYLGKLIGCLLQNKAELIGGLVLIAIAIKTLIEGLCC